MILRGKKPTPWVRGREQITLPVSIPAVLDAIRVVLTTNPIYRDAHENADHTAFEMTVNIPWSLVGMPMRVTVADKAGQTAVSVAVTSWWWLQSGECDGRIRDFVAVLKRQATLNYDGLHGNLA